MPNIRPILVTLLAAGLLLGVGQAGFGQGNPPDAKAKLEAAASKLATFDFGGDNGPLNVITELIVVSKDQPELRKEIAGKLAAVLSSNAPQGAKDFACRQLSVIGAAEQVPALAPLLVDEKLSHMARYALARIPGPASDEALRQALGKVKGKLLVGMINS